MRKNSVRFLFVLVILLVANFAAPSGASGQQQRFYPPYELYKFSMNGNNGYLYIPWYSIGVNSGFTYQGPIGSGPNGCCYTAGVYPRVDEGYTPAPSTGLVPLYQWFVAQGSRSYYYLSTYYAEHGSGYTFNGPMGYVYPANSNNQFAGMNMAQWYSTSRGFWYGRNEPGNQDGFESPPPGQGYVYQGIVCKLAASVMATAPNRCTGPLGNSPPRCDGALQLPYDPPPPPPQCDPNDEQWCYESGGWWWDSSTCTCNYSQNNLWANSLMNKVLRAEVQTK